MFKDTFLLKINLPIVIDIIMLINFDQSAVSTESGQKLTTIESLETLWDPSKFLLYDVFQMSVG